MSSDLELADNDEKKSSNLELADNDEKKKSKNDDCDCSGSDGEGTLIACALIAVAGILAVLFGLCPCFKWKSRLVLMWIWLFGISLTIGLLLNLHFYGPMSSPVGDSDQVLVTEKFNGEICSKLTVSAGKPVNVYLVEGTPNVKLTNRTTYIYDYKVRRIDIDDDYVSLGFYLTKGTTLRVDVTRIFYINTNPYCYLKRGRKGAENGGEQLFEKKPWNTGLLFVRNITESDYYYTTFKKSIIEYYTTPMNLRYTLDRTEFDLSSKPAKANTTRTEFDLDYGKDYAYIVNYENPGSREMVNVVSTCGPRLEIYLPCLFVLPLLIGVVITVVIYRKYGGKE